MKDTKGFTLVELLAVIVILAVVMLLATTAVGPLMDKSRKGALGSEGLALIDAAKMAYQIELMNGGITSSTGSVCFSLNWLNTQQYFEKGTADGYTGSVLVAYNSGTGGYLYSFWISNGSYIFANQTPTPWPAGAFNLSDANRPVTYASDNATAGSDTSGTLSGCGNLITVIKEF